MNAFEIAQKLGGTTKEGQKKFLVCCPAHKDSTPSLAIKDGDSGRVLLFCHAGCRTADVITALRERGLWDTRGPSTPSPARRALSQAKQDTADRRALAQYLWRKRRPVEATKGETYLREHRGIRCPLPRTTGFLPGDDQHPPALIAAFGMAHELEPGVIAIAEHAITAVHLIKLTSDGRKLDVTPNKITIGSPGNAPIVLAPMNDLLSLAICEGIEDALSIHEATGLGAWATGTASRLPAVADAVPDYTDCVTIFADADKAGQENAAKLAARLNARGIFAEVLPSSGAAP